MKMKIKHLILLLSACGFFQSCGIPGTVTNASSYFPQSVTETHTKTTIVAPMSYNMPYVVPNTNVPTIPNIPA